MRREEPDRPGELALATCPGSRPLSTRRDASVRAARRQEKELASGLSAARSCAFPSHRRLADLRRRARCGGATPIGRDSVRSLLLLLRAAVRFSPGVATTSYRPRGMVYYILLLHIAAAEEEE